MPKANQPIDVSEMETDALQRTGFLMLSNKTAEDLPTHPYGGEALAILAFLRSKPPAWRVIPLAIANHFSGWSEKKVRKALALLSAEGHVIKTPIRVNGRIDHWKDRITDANLALTTVYEPRERSKAASSGNGPATKKAPKKADTKLVDNSQDGSLLVENVQVENAQEGASSSISSWTVSSRKESSPLDKTIGSQDSKEKKEEAHSSETVGVDAPAPTAQGAAAAAERMGPDPAPQDQPTPKTKTGATRLSKDWSLPSEWREWAKETFPTVSMVRIELAADQFRDHWHSTTRGALKTDWLSTWRNWCRTEFKREIIDGKVRRAATTPTAEPKLAKKSILDMTPEERQATAEQFRAKWGEPETWQPAKWADIMKSCFQAQAGERPKPWFTELYGPKPGHKGCLVHPGIQENFGILPYEEPIKPSRQIPEANP